MLQQIFFFLSPKKDEEHAPTNFFSLVPRTTKNMPQQSKARQKI